MYKVWSLAAVAVAATLTACIDTPTSISSSEPSVVSSDNITRPSLFKTSKRYRDLGRQPGFGRTADASLQVETWVAFDGGATMTLSSGCGSGESAGDIRSALVSRYTSEGKHLGTQLHYPLSGSTVQISLKGMPRGGYVDVVALVKSADGRRYEVVSARDVAKMLPDVSVAELRHDQRVFRGSQTLILASIRELNGDVGANASCSLLVDGEEVDQARAIWIDAGREVSCAFIHVFRSVGTKQLVARVNNVSPNDYRSDNNQVTSSIVVADPQFGYGTSDFNWTSRLEVISNERAFWLSEGTYEDPVEGIHSSFNERIEQRGSSMLSSNIEGDTPLAFRGDFSVRIRDRIGQVELNDVFDVTTDERYAYDDANMSQRCVIMQRVAPAETETGSRNILVGFFSACTTWDPTVNQDLGTTFSYRGRAGDVIYYGNSWGRYVSADYSDSWAYTDDARYAYGALATGSEYAFQITLTSGDRRLVAEGAYPLTSQEIVEAEPRVCYDNSYDQIIDRFCTESERRYTRYFGSATGRR